MKHQSRSNFLDRFMTSVNNRKVKEVFLKREFYQLQIVGQFNKGFVLATLNNGRDLFILDQHASDERCNLEKFTKNLKIDSQIMMRPRTLQVDSELAKLLKEYPEVFEYNGLKFKLFDDFDQQIKCEKTVKVKLISLPQSYDLQFDESDFYDLLTAVRNYHREVTEKGFEPVDR